MAFSDSVQDASHRSGFFNGRTYPITLRTALCKVIGDRAGVAISVIDLSETFPGYWRQLLSKETFVGRFIPPTVEWRDDFESFKETHELKPNSRLPSMVADRLRWEVIREFGLQCRVGRTLEKSGAAACHVDASALESAAAKVLSYFGEESSVYRGLELMDCKRLLMGMCERLRVNGGVAHRFLESYVEKKGDEWSFNHRNREALPRLPKRGRGRRPTFFATFGISDTFERVIGSGTSLTWCERWLEKWLAGILGPARVKEQALHPILEALIHELCEAGLWQRFEISRSDGQFAWGLDPKKIMVTATAAHHACSDCGHQTTSSAVVSELWQGTSCLRHKCEGRYTASTSDQGSFFADLYERGEIVRLRAAEHTSLLDRPNRERVEKEFMRHPSLATDTNLLSCTPTMEMGVDVGDLSTVVLCSVPPEQSNYVQRVGRGGRRDGNSLALTVATGDPHDLTYYEEPLKLLAGEVQMPAIFLRAPAVLERQLTAYCLDRWIQSDPAALIPLKMHVLYLRMERNEDDQGAFPHAFYHFIDLHLTYLVAGFLEMFHRGELDEPAKDYLRRFIEGDAHEQGPLCYKIAAALSTSFKGLRSLKKTRDQLSRKIGRLKKLPEAQLDEKVQQDLDGMMAERRALSRLIRELDDKQTLNFLTDEGLIPNYAFPEEGVTLHSIILKKPEKTKDDEGKKTIQLEYEHVRPAEAAITELAPGNAFYVQGRKLSVDQVSVEQDDYEAWHFCRTCAHLEPVTEKSEAYTECPRCHCTAWPDTSLKQKMLKMRQVYVRAWDKNVRNLDQKDNRDLQSFNKQTSIDHDKDAITRSYSLKAEGATFAFDFIRQVTLREVNFGQDQPDATSIRIGGKDMQGVGFKVCVSCGKIQPRKSNAEPKHGFDCKHYGKAADRGEFERTFLLYRELESEAIRLLIPSLNQDENVDTQSFVAAIHLGLKVHFGGYLSHLKLSVQQRPLSGGRLKAQHVFVYDGVPGGTGYLKELTRDGEALVEVLEKAYRTLVECSCALDPSLDGCYQCLKAYRFRYVDNLVSRQAALRQLKLILDHRDKIEERSPDEALINPLLESELERRFIENLRQTKGLQVQAEPVNGRPGYLVRIGAAAWRIIPQMDLTERDGVAIHCRPDFILKPLRPSKGMPIAVFLDGFAYHADVKLDNNRIADDIAKRTAVRMSGKYLVWSLTWADLRGDAPDSGSLVNVAYQNLEQVLREQVPEIADLTVFQNPGWNNWELLLALLFHLAKSNDEAPLDHWRTAVTFLACNYPKRVPTSEKQLESGLQELMLGKELELAVTPAPEVITSQSGSPVMRLLSGVPVASLKAKRLDGAVSALWFDDEGEKPAAEFQREWQDLLRTINLMQFVERFACFTKLMIAQGKTSNALEWLLESEREQEKDTMDSVEIEESLLADLEMLEPSLQPILVPLLKAETVPRPEFGFEPTDSHGKCQAIQLEVAWPDLSLGIALPGMDASKLRDQGWTILDAPDCTSDQLLSHFSS